MKAVAHLLEFQEPSTLSSSLTVLGHRLFRKEFRSPEFLDLPIGERVLVVLKLVTVGLHATDPRDKLYGLMGLLGDITGCPILEPDYEKPLDEFWLNLTKFLILEASSLCFLQQPDPGTSPSWVSKWERRFPSLRASPGFGRIHDTIKQHTVVTFSRSGTILYTKVIPIGQVSEYTFIRHNLGQHLIHWRDEIQSLEARLDATPAVLKRYRTKQSIQLALRDLVTKEMDDSQIRDTVDLQKRYVMLMGRLPPDSSSSPKHKTPAVNDLFNLCRKSLPQILEFLTLSSGRIGLIEQRAGDALTYNHAVTKVCMLTGVASLFELVKEGPGYRLSRTCYVDGIQCTSTEYMLKYLERNDGENISLV